MPASPAGSRRACCGNNPLPADVGAFRAGNKQRGAESAHSRRRDSASSAMWSLRRRLHARRSKSSIRRLARDTATKIVDAHAQGDAQARARSGAVRGRGDGPRSLRRQGHEEHARAPRRRRAPRFCAPSAYTGDSRAHVSSSVRRSACSARSRLRPTPPRPSSTTASAWCPAGNAVVFNVRTRAARRVSARGSCIILNEAMRRCRRPGQPDLLHR